VASHTSAVCCAVSFVKHGKEALLAHGEYECSGGGGVSARPSAVHLGELPHRATHGAFRWKAED